MHGEELTFSVIVNTLDRANSLRILLKSLEFQTYSNFEVIVVVGPTKDHTLEILMEYADRVTIVHCPNDNISLSRNLGLKAAKGDIVAYIDDDAIPSNNWLLNLKKVFSKNKFVCATGGVVFSVYPWFSLIQHKLGLITSSAKQFDVRKNLLDGLPLETPDCFWTMRMMGTNMAYRRKVLTDIGGFDEFFKWGYEDAEIALRLSASGLLIRPVDGACVYHVPASSRNRKVFTSTGRWWLYTRTFVYFCVRYSLLFKLPIRRIIIRMRDYLLARFRFYLDSYVKKQISTAKLLNYVFQEITSTALSLYKAIKGCTLYHYNVDHVNSKEISKDYANSREIRKFITNESKTQSIIDPISGYQPSVQLSEPTLRIALLSHHYPPKQYDGIGRSTNMLAKGLFELGHQVHVLTHGEQPTVKFYDGAYVHYVPYQLNRYNKLIIMPSLYHLLNYSHYLYEYILKLISNDDIQILDSPLWLFDGFIAAVSKILPVVVRPVTSQVQLSEIINQKDKEKLLIGEIEKRFLNIADFVVANSKATRDAIANIYNFSKSDIDVVYYGIEPVEQTEIRPPSYSVLPEKFTVLYVGRLEKRKGIQDLFAAIPLVLKQIPNVQFVIAGADNSINDGFKNETGMDYPSYFAKHYPECLSHVRFLGEVPEEKLNALYQSCDLFVAPSLYESFGLIYLEAMNFAKPVIGCRAGGVPEVVNDGVTGRLVDPSSPRQLAEAIVTLLRSPRLLYEYGMAGRQRLLDYFTHIHMARGFERIYRLVLSQTKANDTQS